MQETDRLLFRLSAARILLTGAAILAGAAGPVGTRRGATEDTALANPRVVTSDGLVALPQPMAPSDAQRLRRVFAAQARGDIAAATAETDEALDTVLLGHVLADRYLGGPGRAQPHDLTKWLDRYGDLPDAAAIQGLLASLLPPGAPAPPVPPPLLAPPAIAGGDDVERSERLMTRNPALDRSVRDAARAGHADRADRLVARTPGMNRQYGALLRAEIAQILFTQGRDAEALALADAAHAQARGQVGLAPYIGGLAAWRLERPDLARPLFEAAFRAPLTLSGQHAGAAFWAARAHLRTRDPGSYAPWMQRAAQIPRTFYGLLARRALGQGILAPTAFSLATLGQADVDAVAAIPAGHRALALLQVGQGARATAELQLLWSQTRDLPGFTRSIMLVAKAAGLLPLAEQLAALVQPAAVRLPTARLQPAGGFRTDPALVYALARLESNFDADAVSPAGARGLMQLMPRTADFLLGEDAPPRARRLHDPATNLDLGQRYLLQLAQYDLVGADLIRLLASYNAGPGSFGRWVGGVRHNGDPLLFIESVPGDETRAYIPRALAYSWLYAAQLGLPSPSLDELAAGAWPRFQARSPRTELFAKLH